MKYILLCVLLCFGISGCAGARNNFAKRQEIGNYKWAVKAFEETIDYPELLAKCGYDRSKLPTPKFKKIEQTRQINRDGESVVLLGWYYKGVIHYSSDDVIWHETFHYIVDYFQLSHECLNEFGARMLLDIAKEKLPKTQGRK